MHSGQKPSNLLEIFDVFSYRQIFEPVLLTCIDSIMEREKNWEEKAKELEKEQRIDEIQEYVDHIEMMDKNLSTSSNINGGFHMTDDIINILEGYEHSIEVNIVDDAKYIAHCVANRTVIDEIAWEGKFKRLKDLYRRIQGLFYRYHQKTSDDVILLRNMKLFSDKRKNRIEGKRKDYLSKWESLSFVSDEEKLEFFIENEGVVEGIKQFHDYVGLLSLSKATDNMSSAL